jgi:hypothetical protein
MRARAVVLRYTLDSEGFLCTTALTVVYCLLVNGGALFVKTQAVDSWCQAKVERGWKVSATVVCIYTTVRLERIFCLYIVDQALQ